MMASGDLTEDDYRQTIANLESSGLGQMDEIYAAHMPAIWKTRAKSLHLPDRYLSYLSGFVYWAITSM